MNDQIIERLTFIILFILFIAFCIFYFFNYILNALFYYCCWMFSSSSNPHNMDGFLKTFFYLIIYLTLTIFFYF